MTLAIAILEWLTALTLFAVTVVLIYAGVEFVKVLKWLREFIKLYGGPDHEIDKKAEPTFLKVEKPWNQDADGTD